MANIFAPVENTIDAPFLSGEGTHGEYIHSRNRFYNPRFRLYSEDQVWSRLHAALIEYEKGGTTLWDRLLKSVFGKFLSFFSTNWVFNSRSIALLYFHMVYPDNDEELHFNFDEKRIKFGKREFGFITGFRFGDYNVSNIREESKCLDPPSPSSNHPDSISLSKIINAITSGKCDAETVYRMALVYVIHGVVMALEPNTTFSKNVFYFVDDLERVENYPWGEIVFNNFIWNWRKVIPQLLRYGPESVNPQPSLFGCLHALQVWSFHVLPWTVEVGKFAKLIVGNEQLHPAILRWKCNAGGSIYQTIWDNLEKIKNRVVIDALTTEGDMLEVVKLGLSAEVVRAAPRALPIPIAQHERPQINEDVRHRQSQRIEQAQATASADQSRVETVHLSVPLDSLRPFVQQLVQQALADSEAQLRAANSEINRLNAIVQQLSTDHANFRMEQANFRMELQSIMYSNLEIRQVTTSEHHVFPNDPRADDPFQDDASRASEHHDVHTDPVVVNFGLGNASGVSEHHEHPSDPTGDDVPPSLNTLLTEYDINNLYSCLQPSQEMPVVDDFDLNVDFPNSCTSFFDRICLPNHPTGTAQEAPSKSIVVEVPNAQDQPDKSWSDITKAAGILLAGDSTGRLCTTSVPITPLRDTTATPASTRSAQGQTDFTVGPTVVRDPGKRRRHPMQTRKNPKKVKHFTDGSHVVTMPSDPSPKWVSIKVFTPQQIEEFDKWLADPNAPMLDFFKGNLGERVDNNEKTGKEFFTCLLENLKELEKEHVDAYMSLIIRQMQEYPRSFKPNTVICYSDFPTYCYTGYRDSDIFTPGTLPIEPWMLNYTNKWGPHTVAYMPFNISDSHWATLEINIPKWKIRIIDCDMKYNKILKKLGRGLQGIGVVIKRCLELNPQLSGNRVMLDPLLGDPLVIWVDPQHFPQMLVPGDSGLYAMKHIEHLVHDAPIYEISSELMVDYRRNIALKLFHQTLDF